MKEITMSEHLQAIKEFDKEFPNVQNVVTTLDKWATSFKFTIHSTYPSSFTYEAYCALDREWRMSIKLDIYNTHINSLSWSEYFKSLAEAKRGLSTAFLNMVAKSFSDAGF